MWIRAVALVTCVLPAACGGASPSTPGVTPSNPGTFTISAAGVSPKELTVVPGTRVLFVNSDTRRHDMASDPHPEHSDCRELEPVGGLSPGQSRETENLNTVKTCGFHDHGSPDNAALKGRIVIR